ncbi:carboxymethylenebutenolidase [Kibdelosporangium banguiense]|uniref:Carboxymethylenebutenolidase n=1 Tax=Kibdelosporangium banguiense TaxID=1365924 RepID=A0ABS4T8Z6_9PSEU|nr:dienelactone hydrolase family protein [Kibdelosporangium banguiense]MBP2320896.1 carboxymethylenebutenolidase [Kibdelosporangium banguiense]
MTEFEKYVVEEHIEDFNDRVISRRELIRRVTLITGSTAATMGLLTAMGCSAEPTGAPVSPTGRTTDNPQEFATPPAQPTQDGITVQENDPRIKVSNLVVRGTDGVNLISYHASPASGASAGGILVIHENRGLVPHTKDVVRRVATAGFQALAVDLLSRDGGADKLTDSAAYSAALSKRPVDAMVSDVREALAALSSAGNGDKIGMTGFCFGGGMTWNSLAAGVQMKAAVPFYGPAPANVAALASVKAAVFGVYAEKDARITGSKDAVEAQLKQSGQPYQVTVYPGVDHAFHNDTGARYNAAQAEAAWIATIEWFRRHVI